LLAVVCGMLQGFNLVVALRVLAVPDRLMDACPRYWCALLDMAEFDNVVLKLGSSEGVYRLVCGLVGSATRIAFQQVPIATRAA
jgi:hypothetical protein